MATALFFHAHPDDEAIGTGGSIAKAKANGHRAIIVTATGGEHGEVADGVLADGETLGQRRHLEMKAAAAALGADRHEFLGYVDSGMMGTPENEAAECFWKADLDEAAARLCSILDAEQVDVLVVYDDHGLYGHPDHIQVHRVGIRAAEMAGTALVYESTVDRDRMMALMARAREMGVAGLDDGEADARADGVAADDATGRGAETPDAPTGIDDTFGSPGELITTRVDVSDFLEIKRAAMRAHSSQIAETSFFLAMPDEVFAQVWGTEEYIRRGAPAGTFEDDLFAPLS